MNTTKHTAAPAVLEEAPLVQGGLTFAGITDKISGIVERPTPKLWWLLFGIALSGTLILAGSIGWLFYEGIGIWGVNVPVGWGWAIVNFVFWVGIGHAGRLDQVDELVRAQRDGFFERRDGILRGVARGSPVGAVEGPVHDKSFIRVRK